MTIPLFEPPVNPMPGPCANKPRTLVAEFGDGYEQESGDGINIMRETWNGVYWEGLTQAEADSITDFFEANAGSPFRYTMPGRSTEKKYKCSEWTPETVAYNVVNIRAVFRQVFEL